MSGRAQSLIKKANRILSKTNSFTRTVYLRTTGSTGGDPLLGRYGSLMVNEDVLVPQPFVERLGRERIPGGHAKAETVLVGTNMKIGDDYQMIVTSTMVTLDQLQNPQCQFVFRDSDGTAEVLSIHDFETVSIDKTAIAYSVICRSVQTA